MAIKKIKLPGMAQPVDIGTTWANVSGKPDLMTSSEISVAINAAFATNDAMVFKGTIGAGGTVTQLPATHEAGWTYKVISNGSLAGQTCEIGDMIVCVADGEIANADDWTVIQTNVDGAVTGPASSTAGHIATFTGATGKVIQDSGFTIAKSVPADAQFTDTTYENKTAVSGGTDVSLVSTGDKYNWNNSIVISDTQPTGNGNKLWIDTDAGSGNSYQVPTVAESLAMGVSDAKVGDLVRVNSVDANGKPTSWKHVPLNEIKCNKNLLDNWYFVGGGSQLGDGVFPINQRGQTTYSDTGYGIDRWFGGPSITQAGILFQNVNSWIEQRFQIGSVLINQYTYTVSALLSDGSLCYGSITCDTSLYSQTFFENEYIASFAVYVGGTYHNIGFGTRQTNVTIVAVKLELGSEQTLCHNEGTEENPIWVLNEIPDYNEQFEKCLKYLRITSWNATDYTVGVGNIKDNTTVDAFFDFTMVKNPYISPTNGANWKLLTASGSAITPTSIAPWFASSSKVGVRFTIPSTTEHETLCVIPSSETKVIFSAEL